MCFRYFSHWHMAQLISEITVMVPGVLWRVHKGHAVRAAPVAWLCGRVCAHRCLHTQTYLLTQPAHGVSLLLRGAGGFICRLYKSMGMGK